MKKYKAKASKIGHENASYYNSSYRKTTEPRPSVLKYAKSIIYLL